MSNRYSNRGKIIDMDALMAQNDKSVAIGNMGVNAKGDVVKDGVTVQTSEDRVRAYYKNNPKSSTAKASLKGQRPKLSPDDVQSDIKPKTVAAAEEDLRQQRMKAQAEPSVTETVQEILNDAKTFQETVMQQPDEFDAPEGLEPIGYKEVELPNGDIEMVPIYREEDR